MSDILRDFLADRDQPCPGCGYNLRGVQEPVCPECGRTLELALARPARGWLLFLTFAIVLAGASIDTTRAGRSVRDQARATTWVQFTTAGSISISRTNPSTSAFTYNTGPAARTRTFGPSTTGRPNALGRAAPLSPGPAANTTIAVTPAPPPAGTVSAAPLRFSRISSSRAGQTWKWSNVPWQVWTALGWSGGLAIAAAALLVLILWHRARIARDGPWRLAVIAAVALPAIFLAGHLAVLVRELLA
jgi:hypothetical protein